MRRSQEAALGLTQNFGPKAFGVGSILQKESCADALERKLGDRQTQATAHGTLELATKEAGANLGQFILGNAGALILDDDVVR